jgi:ABC-type branched-subunit amino acid transport system substrate-binding protein
LIVTDFVGVTARTAWRRATRHSFLGLLLFPILLLLAWAAEEATGPGLADVARGPDTPVVIPSNEPIVVGVSVALTGPVARRGQQYRDTVVVAVERWKAARGSQIDGHDLVVVAEDDGCSEGDVAQKAAARLLRRPGLGVS